MTCSRQLVESGRQVAIPPRSRGRPRWQSAAAALVMPLSPVPRSMGHCQAPRSIKPGGISLLHSRADLAFRPSSNRSPLPDFCLPSNLGNSFDELEPPGFYTTDIRHDAEFSAHAEIAA